MGTKINTPLFQNNKENVSGTDQKCIGSSVDYTVRKLAEKFSVVNMKSTSQAAENVFIENEMFIEMSDSISEQSGQQQNSRGGHPGPSQGHLLSLGKKIR